MKKYAITCVSAHTLHVLTNMSYRQNIHMKTRNSNPSFISKALVRITKSLGVMIQTSSLKALLLVQLHGLMLEYFASFSHGYFRSGETYHNASILADFHHCLSSRHSAASALSLGRRFLLSACKPLTRGYQSCCWVQPLIRQTCELNY